MNFANAFEKCVSKPFLERVKYLLDWRLVAYERKLAKQFVKEILEAKR